MGFGNLGFYLPKGIKHKVARKVPSVGSGGSLLYKEFPT